MPSPSIYPCLWFDHEAVDAVNFYTSLFKPNSRITKEAFYDGSSFEFNQKKAGDLMTVEFELAGQRFTALNGGPYFKFTPAISFYVICEVEDELQALWQGLSEGGQTLMELDKYEWSEKYGWVQDRFGLSWQISLGKISDVGQTITPSLLFVGDKYGKAEEAIEMYTSVFSPAQIAGILRDEPKNGESQGMILHAQFSLNGHVFMAMESPLEHGFTFNEATSFTVLCETQEEIDHYWDRLTAGGDENAQRCGWLKDRFGVSWQIVPRILTELLASSDTKQSKRVMECMLKMKKLDVNQLMAAANATK